jgi:hypothetical protein
MIAVEIVTFHFEDDVILESSVIPRERFEDVAVGAYGASCTICDSLTINGRRFERSVEDRAHLEMWFDAVTFAEVIIHTTDERWGWLVGGIVSKSSQ